MWVANLGNIVLETWTLILPPFFSLMQEPLLE